jgi:hypothetical protein
MLRPLQSKALLLAHTSGLTELEVPQSHYNVVPPVRLTGSAAASAENFPLRMSHSARHSRHVSDSPRKGDDHDNKTDEKDDHAWKHPDRWRRLCWFLGGARCPASRWPKTGVTLVSPEPVLEMRPRLYEAGPRRLASPCCRSCARSASASCAVRRSGSTPPPKP